MIKIKYTCIFLLLAVLASCNPSRGGKTNKLPVISVSIVPQKYFVEALASGIYQVEAMVPQGSSPETYDPVPRQLVSLEKSVVYLRIGYIGFEQTWMEKLSANAPHLEFFDTSQGINLIMEQGMHTSADHGMSAIEPHLWCSPKNAAVITLNVCKMLSSLDRQHEPLFIKRCDSLTHHIMSVDSLIRRQLSNPKADKSFAIYHPSLSYFARDYKLNQITIERNGKEPSPSDLRMVIDQCRKLKVHVIFVQPEFDRRNAEIIAQQIGARVVQINPLNQDWDKEMLNVARALTSSNK